MSATCKKIMRVRFDRFDALEQRLQALAAKGQVLERCGPYVWTFRRCQPQKRSYAVAFFPEGSIFASEPDERQQSYLDLAAAAGWHFVSAINQLHIFCNEAEQPIPFETDEAEKLRSIEKSMRKSFVPSMLLLLLLFALNTFLQWQSLLQDPIDFLCDPLRLLSACMSLTVVLYAGYALWQYFLWRRCSQRSIALGGGCVRMAGPLLRGIDFCFCLLICALLCGFLWQAAQELPPLVLLVCLAQLPILLLIFWGVLRFLKKRKTSAFKNKIISCGLLLLASFGYLVLLMLLVFRLGNGKDGGEYRTLDSPAGGATGHTFRLYHDTLPLRCEDLYGALPSAQYSYRAEVSESLFLRRQRYAQDAPPARLPPPQISYTLLTPRFDFVYHQVQQALLEQPAWRSHVSLVPLDNALFGTRAAYQEHDEQQAMPRYLLFFDTQIVLLELDEPLTEAQIPVVMAKLGL